MIVNISARRAGIPYTFNGVVVNSVADMRDAYESQGYTIDGYSAVDMSQEAAPLNSAAIPTPWGNSYRIISPVRTSGWDANQIVLSRDPNEITEFLSLGGQVLRADNTPAQIMNLGNGWVRENIVIDGVGLISGQKVGGVYPTNIPGSPDPVAKPAVTGLPQTVSPMPVGAAQFPVQRWTVSLDPTVKSTGPASADNQPAGAGDQVFFSTSQTQAKKSDDLLIGLAVAIAFKVFFGL